MIRKALSNFQLSPNITENIMRKIEHIKPTTPSSSKPFIPWVIGASSIALLVLMLGLGSRHKAYFQQPYSLDSQSELAVELIDVPVVLNLDEQPDARNQLGANADNQGNNEGERQDSNQVLSDKEDYTQWRLPKGAKRRFGKGGAAGAVYSPDGTRLAVASSIGIWIYDVKTGEPRELLTGHTDGVNTVSFSPDGRLLASGSGDTTVRIWDVKSGEYLFPCMDMRKG